MRPDKKGTASTGGGEPKRIRLAIILRMLGFGGAERQVVELCRGLDRSRFDVTVILFFSEDGYEEALIETGVRVKVLSTRQAYKREVWTRLVRCLRKGRFDVVHTWLPIANFVGGAAARWAGVPRIICSMRNTSPFSLRDIFCAMDWIAFHAFAHQVVVNSFSGKESLRKDYSLPERKICVIRNGKDCSIYETSESRESCREKLGWPQDNFVVVAVGRIAKQKGHRYLMEAARLAKSKGEKWKIFIVGKAEDDYDEVARRIKEYGLERIVRLIDPQADIARVLKAADVLVHPSLWEGLPNVVLEAMIAGVPVAASDIPAHREIITDHKEGLLFPVKSSSGIFGAVGTLARDFNLRNALASAARERVLEKFSLTRIVCEYERMYESEVGVNPGSGDRRSIL